MAVNATFAKVREHILFFIEWTICNMKNVCLVPRIYNQVDESEV